MKTLILPISLVAASLCAMAAAPTPDHKVSKQANWVAHLDFQSILNSRIGSHILDEARKDPQFTQQLNGLKAVFGLDLEKLGVATAYGSGKEDEAIILAHGGMNATQLEGFAALNENVQIQKRGKRTLYSFKKGAFSALGPQAVIAAPNQKLLAHGLDVLDGKAPSQAESAVSSHLTGMIDKPMAMMTMSIGKVMALQNQSIPAPQAAIMKKAELVGFAMGESGNSMRMAMALRASDEETAVHLENVMRGASSMLALGADVGIDPQLDEILPKMKTSVTRKKRNVGLMVEIDTALVLAKITEEMEKRSPKKENALDSQ